MAARKSDVKYDVDVKPRLAEVKEWAEKGLIDKDIAHNLGISYSTFNKWKSEHAEMRESLKIGKEVADEIVENKLYQRAIGYNYEETSTEKEGERIKTKKTIKEMPPDVTAQIFWLKNRLPAKWRDKQEIDNNVTIGLTDKDRELIDKFVKRTNGKD
mgnify:CR=1 FL=1